MLELFERHSSEGLSKQLPQSRHVSVPSFLSISDSRIRLPFPALRRQVGRISVSTLSPRIEDRYDHRAVFSRQLVLRYVYPEKLLQIT